MSKGLVLGALMMGSIMEGKIKTLQPQQPSTLLEEMKLLKEMQEQSGSSVKPCKTSTLLRLAFLSFSLLFPQIEHASRTKFWSLAYSRALSGINFGFL